MFACQLNVSWETHDKRLSVVCFPRVTARIHAVRGIAPAQHINGEAFASNFP
jgi:hypothetical protein